MKLTESNHYMNIYNQLTVGVNTIQNDHYRERTLENIKLATAEASWTDFVMKFEVVVAESPRQECKLKRVAQDLFLKR